jgi:transposase-like protein
MSRGHTILKNFLQKRGAWDNNPFKPTTTSTATKTGGAPSTGHAFQEQNSQEFGIRINNDTKKLNLTHFDPDKHAHLGSVKTLKRLAARNQMAKLAKEKANINKAKKEVQEQNKTSLGGIENDDKFHNQIHTRNQQRRRQYNNENPDNKGYNPGGSSPAGTVINKIKGPKMNEDIGYPTGAQMTFANNPNQTDSSGQSPAPGLAIGDQVTCNRTGRWGSVVAQHADGTYTVQYAVRETGVPSGQETGPASWWTLHSRQNAGLGLDNTKNLGTEPSKTQGVRENIAYRSMNRQENDLILAEAAADRSNYSWPHSAAVNPHSNLKVGHKVRSYDFPGLTDQHYVEGHVTNMGLGTADIRVNKVVRDGKEVLPIPHHMQQVTAPLGKHNMFGHYGVHKITNQVDVVNPRPKATLKTVGNRSTGGKKLK